RLLPRAGGTSRSLPSRATAGSRSPSDPEVVDDDAVTGAHADVIQPSAPPGVVREGAAPAISLDNVGEAAVHDEPRTLGAGKCADRVEARAVADVDGGGNAR